MTAGPWIRREFPNLFYIVQPSTPTGGEYYYATWTGISGDAYYRNGAGAELRNCDQRMAGDEYSQQRATGKGVSASLCSSWKATHPRT